VSKIFLQPISYRAVLSVFALTSLGPGIQSLGLGLEYLTLGNKCASMMKCDTALLYHGAD